MPPTHTDEGLRAAEAIRAEHGTKVGILVLSQYVETTFALRLVADGVGDTYLPSAYARAPYFPAGLGMAPFSPALYDTFAIVSRSGARLSSGVRELLTDLEGHMRSVADALDPGGVSSGV
jgi:hypothetical protein